MSGFPHRVCSPNLVQTSTSFVRDIHTPIYSRHRLTMLFFTNLALHITKSFIAVYTSEEYSSLFLTEWITICNNDLKFEQYFSVKTYFRHSCSSSHCSVIVCKQSFKTLVTNTKKHKVQSYAVWSFYVLILAQYQCQGLIKYNRSVTKRFICLLPIFLFLIKTYTLLLVLKSPPLKHTPSYWFRHLQKSPPPITKRSPVGWIGVLQGYLFVIIMK